MRYDSKTPDQREPPRPLSCGPGSWVVAVRPPYPCEWASGGAEHAGCGLAAWAPPRHLPPTQGLPATIWGVEGRCCWPDTMRAPLGSLCINSQENMNGQQQKMVLEQYESAILYRKLFTVVCLKLGQNWTNKMSLELWKLWKLLVNSLLYEEK